MKGLTDSMCRRRKIFLFADHIDCGVKGGGAQRSLVNLIDTFGNTYGICFISSEYVGTRNQFLNRWLRKRGVPGFYPSSKFRIACLFMILSLRHRDAVFYLNGFYSKSVTIIPLTLNFFIQLFLEGPSIFVAPRGGVSSGALSVRSKRKHFYLWLLSASGLLKNVLFHVVSESESLDIVNIFGPNYRKKCIVAPNVVEKPSCQLRKNFKPKFNFLRVLYLSRIHPIKNLMFMNVVLPLVKSRVIFDIYGNVDDTGYFQMCKREFSKYKTHHQIKFCGFVDPSKVREIFSKYDVCVLPTLGENFGHTVFESLSVGTPVVVSDRTIWKKSRCSSVTDLSLSDPKQWANQLDWLASLPLHEMERVRLEAFQFAERWYSDQKYDWHYEQLFELKAK